MSVLAFIKENRVLVAGITLPLLLVGLLAYAKTLPGKNVPDPQYKLVYTSQTWNGQGKIYFDIDNNGILTTEFKKADNPSQNNQQVKASIYIYSPKTSTTDTIEIKVSDEDAKLEKTTLSVPEMNGVKFSSKTISPDGYVFEPYHYKNHTLITDIFISSSRNYGPNLNKDGRYISLPQANPYYGNIEFLGWIIEDKVQGQ
ncbi:MAG TPA: hypothetical protein PLE43_06195 [Alphaproteobacteria bacterium]|nr:hypothetical protein [Alphaproteobacteria bacterium]